NHIRMREAAFDAGAMPQLLVDRKGFLARANQAARQLFGLTPADIGRRFQDLEVSYRPLELRSHIDQVLTSQALDSVSGVTWRDRQATVITLDVFVQPLMEGNRPLGVIISFADMSQFVELREELEQSNQELETAMEELQSTNEELETTNEELQSTNEELETTNE